MTIDMNRLNLRYDVKKCNCEKPDVDSFEVLDSRGIYITRACSNCMDRKLKGYREDVLYGPSYEAEEPIEPDESIYGYQGGGYE